MYNINLGRYNDKGLSGLVNFGNTCYMNTGLQCMSNIIPLTDYFLKKKFISNLDSNRIETNLSIQYYKLLEGIWNSNCIVSPQSFRKNVIILCLRKEMNMNLVSNGQNDVQEFIVFLIDNIHLSLSKKVNMVISGNVENELDKKAMDAMTCWKNFFKNDYSIIVDLFYGQLNSAIYDLDKNLLSTNYDPICYFSIPISDKTNNVYDCFNLYTEYEKLDKENWWYNEKTKEYVECYKKLNFWSLPNVLIVVLKRFKKNGEKIFKNIDFPLINLDLSKYCVGYKKKKNVYDLWSISNHTGSLGSGHYYSYCKNINGKWFNYNDSNVNEIDSENIVTDNAYCLFYVKQNLIKNLDN